MSLPSMKIDRPFTYADYLTWPEEERWEVCDGVPMYMGPAPMRKHQSISMNLTRILTAAIPADGKCKLYSAPFDVRLSKENASDDAVTTVVQPDLSLICDTSKLDDRGCMGAPDVIFEIVSPSSGAKDLKIKRDLYEKHGVQEYWIVQPESETVMVYILTDEIYPKSEVYARGDEPALRALPEVKIPVDFLFSE